MGWLKKRKEEQDRQRAAELLTRLAKKTGKKLVVDPLTGKILELARVKAVREYRKQLAKNKRLCVVCNKEPMVRPGYVHPGCAMQLLGQIQPKTIAELDSPEGRRYADTWGYGLMSALGCGCDIIGWHTCERFRGLYSWQIDEYE